MLKEFIFCFACTILHFKWSSLIQADLNKMPYWFGIKMDINFLWVQSCKDSLELFNELIIKLELREQIALMRR